MTEQADSATKLNEQVEQFKAQFHLVVLLISRF